MSLIVEIIQKIRLLLDKPISTLTKNQITQLVNKQLAPTDDLLVIFAKKYRTDLLLYLIEAQPVTPEKLQFLVRMIIDKLLQFKLEDAVLLWRNILVKSELKGVRQQYTQKLLKDALKNTNQTLKMAQLQLLKQNANMLWQWKEGRIFEDFNKNFINAFSEVNIYLPPYPSLLHLLFSKAQSVEKDLIQNDTRKQLLAKLIDFLNTTKTKQSFSFQNQCLKTVTLILLSKKTHINDLLLLYACQKMLEQYLWKKPTRQEAYYCKQAAKKIHDQIKKENQDKMLRNYDPVEPKPEKNILIEQVIDKANEYLKHNKIIIYQSAIEQKIQRSNYLKSGVGNGGGKSVILTSVKKKNETKHLDELVQSCFKHTNNSFFKQKQIVQQNLQQSSMYASSITIEDDKDFVQISNLIDLAYQSKFDSQPYG